jgi:DNA-3-methyladenine glycosylase
LGGPGSVAKALGITIGHTGLSLLDDQIWIEDRGIEIADEAVLVGPRIGVDYAADDAALPYRFRVSPQQAESLA